MSIRTSEDDFFQKLSSSIDRANSFPILKYKKNNGYLCELFPGLRFLYIENFEYSSEKLLNLIDRKIKASSSRDPDFIRNLSLRSMCVIKLKK